jgi:hypothetical protein
MTDTKDVNVEVRGEDIIITAPGTDHLVIYSKREGSVELRARKLYGPLDFRLRAWTLANHKAQELGWSEPELLATRGRAAERLCWCDA